MTYIHYLILPMRKSSRHPNKFNTYSCTAKYSLFWSFVKDWNKLDTDIRDSSNSVIRQKSESQNGSNKKTKYAKFSEKWTFLTSDSHTYVVVCFVFLISSFWDLPFWRIIAYFAKPYWNLLNLLKRKPTILITLWELSD